MIINRLRNGLIFNRQVRSIIANPRTSSLGLDARLRSDGVALTVKGGKNQNITKLKITITIKI